jgi:hypothetical protein
MGFVRGGRTKVWVHTHKTMSWTWPWNAPLTENVALCYSFSANSNPCSVKPRGIETMFWGMGNQKADTFGLWERQDVCLPLCKGFFVVTVNCCVYSRNRCKFLRILTLLILLIKGPVHGEKCVNMCIVKSCFLVLFWTSLFMYFCMLYIFWDCN